MATILLIEDEAVLRALFCAVLETFGGHSVVAAANGHEGIALFSEEIDLVLTDMKMPGQSGLQTAAILRERAPHIPIILMSGHADPPSEIPGLGEHRFLGKPFPPETLCAAVAEVLGASRADQADAMRAESTGLLVS